MNLRWDEHQTKNTVKEHYKQKLSGLSLRLEHATVSGVTMWLESEFHIRFIGDGARMVIGGSIPHRF